LLTTDEITVRHLDENDLAQFVTCQGGLYQLLLLPPLTTCTTLLLRYSASRLPRQQIASTTLADYPPHVPSPILNYLVRQPNTLLNYSPSELPLPKKLLKYLRRLPASTTLSLNYVLNTSTTFADCKSCFQLLFSTSLVTCSTFSNTLLDYAHQLPSTTILLPRLPCFLDYPPHQLPTTLAVCRLLCFLDYPPS
jgi:hypothetical protein